MREAMYGWMTRWLKGEGKGSRSPSRSTRSRSSEDLACFPGADERPEDLLFPPTFAGRAGRELVAKANDVDADATPRTGNRPRR